MAGEEESDGYLNMADANNPTGRSRAARQPAEGDGYLDMKAVCIRHFVLFALTLPVHT
jgi:hypothetical protein